MWPSILILSTLFTGLASIYLIRKYKRATRKAMQESSDYEHQEKEQFLQKKKKIPLTIKVFSDAPDVDHSYNISELYSKARRSFNSVASIYFLAGMVYVLVMVFTYMLAYHESFILVSFFLYLISFSWPLLIITILIKTFRLSKILKILGLYLASFLLIAVIAIIKNPDLTLAALIIFWMYINLPVTVLIYIILRRQIRAVAPMLFAFMLLAVTGSLLAVVLADNNDSVLWVFVDFGQFINVGALFIFGSILFAGFLMFSIIGWQLLKLLGKGYRNKKFSEDSLLVDSLWLIFSIVQSVEITNEDPMYIFGGLIGFSLYKLTTFIGFRWRRKKMHLSTDNPNLLWLRVFNSGKQGAMFFDNFSKWWRCIGPISMISGPDLMTTSLEPNEFLDFVGGKLSRQFVSDENDLNKRLANQDLSRDPDSKFRTNEFFCRTNTWKMTMQKLALKCDFVLMDLRDFTQNNQGCIYEISQLLELVSLERTLVLINSNTNISFLEETLYKLWDGVSDNSPNLQIDAPTVRFIKETNNKISMKYLFYLLDHGPSKN